MRGLSQAVSVKKSCGLFLINNLLTTLLGNCNNVITQVLAKTLIRSKQEFLNICIEH